ncbi:hypothetical protein, partial [Actinobacillus pleuropneumoniae]|uniref:hypothetical protein n=1 Tax=Actinobacillus pleuropneumoniae TaxID=715 RepID=UPI00227CB1E1
AHRFMIACFVKHFNDLKEEFQGDSKSKRKKLEKQRGLKEKCNHLEEAITHIKAMTQSMHGEASTKISEKKEPQFDDSVNQQL